MSFKLYKQFYNEIEDILQPLDFVKFGKKTQIANIASVFDIEASSFYQDGEKCACMYAWVFGINGKCIRGRTWEEFDNVIHKVVDYYKLNLNRRLIIYVHNLPYEFQWIKHRFKWEEVFSVDLRKPIYAITSLGIEFRCSYILTGYSLETWGKNLTKYKINKAVGDLDYDKIRHNKTELTNKEWGYILNDGLVVMAGIQEEIERLGSLSKIPFTNTGYVRNLFRDKCLKGDYRFEYSKLIKRLTLTKEDYEQSKRAFMGGFTHANHLNVGKTIENVASFDFTSSYPAVFLSEKFPMCKPISYTLQSKEDFNNKIKSCCCIFDIKFVNIRSKFDCEHYISKYKCYKIENYVLDNGRVVEADELAMTITEVDYDIIEKTYEWDKCYIANFKIMYKDYLPKPFLETLLELYKNKTSLKDVEDMVQEYMKSKGMINASYGMAVTDICRDEIIYDNKEDWKFEPVNVDKSINEYNNSSSRFLYYYWGIWDTAYARRNLWSGILEFKEDYIYSDTDSLKVSNYEKHLDYINKYNEEIKNKIKKCLSSRGLKYSLAEPYTIKGIKKPIGVWDFEGVYEKFKTMGAKRYIYTKNNELHITISGVSKTKGVEYLLYKYKKIDNVFDNFDDGLIFPAVYHKNKSKKKHNGSGKLTHTYIDDYKCGYVTDYKGVTEIYCEYSSVHLEPTSYEMSLESEFLQYLFSTGLKYKKILYK